MLQIRRNAFETNSSSMHSLVVSKRIKPYTKRELALGYEDWNKERDDDFKLWDYEGAKTYERSPFEVLRTPLDKLRYYCAATLGTRDKPDEKNLERITNFIMRQTGITNPDKIKLYAEVTTYRGSHYIDYGAVYCNDSGQEPMDYVAKHNISMEELILNPKYTIIVDGDEYCLFQSLFDAGIISTDELEDISSGSEFWESTVYNLGYHWIAEKIKQGKLSDDDFVEDLFDYYTTYQIQYTLLFVDKDSEYNPEIFKRIVSKVKSLRPDMKVRLVFGDYSKTTTLEALKAKYDTSMFDEVVIKYE